MLHDSIFFKHLMILTWPINDHRIRGTVIIGWFMSLFDLFYYILICNPLWWDQEDTNWKSYKHTTGGRFGFLILLHIMMGKILLSFVFFEPIPFSNRMKYWYSANHEMTSVTKIIEWFTDRLMAKIVSLVISVVKKMR